MARTATRKKPHRNGTKPRALAPKTNKAKPGSERPTFGLIVQRQAGVRVTEDTALTLGAVYACVKVISEDIAGLPWHVHEKRAGGKGSEERPEDPADWLLHTQANPETPAFQFRETIIAHALTWGNGYAEIERDGAGRPVWMWLITPDRVKPRRAQDANNQNGRILYEVANPTGPPTFLEADDVYHLRGLGFDGLIGYSVIQLAARSIGAGIALDAATTDFFANDSTPGGILTHPHRLSDPARKNLVESWERRHQGQSNRRKVAILEEGMDWKQTGLPPDDTKLIEQRQFTPADICRWFRVKPHKIADLTRSTFSNIEAENTSHVTDTLLPWGRRLETEANIKLFGRTNRGRRYSRINFNAFLRGDTATRFGAYQVMLDRGVFSINDILALEDRNPIGPDGDKRFVQQNMQLLEKAGEDVPIPPQPAPNPNEPDPVPTEDDGDAETGEEQMRQALRPVFEDACRRLLLRERDRTKAALKGGNGELAAWVAKVESEHLGYVRTILQPPSDALALVSEAEGCIFDVAVGIIAANHLEGFKARIHEAITNPAAVDGWEVLAHDMSMEIIRQLSAAVGAAR